MVFFRPADFTFVRPTEIAACGRLNGEFVDRDASAPGVSTDSEYVHLAGRRNHPGLNSLPFPMLADIRRELATAAGVLGDDGVA
jgi:peroxiredoxin (alkyl hydroperoxide reductase subunit C)